MPFFRAHCFIFIFLAMATFLLHAWIEEYEQIGPNVLTGEWNFQAPQSGRVEITENGLILHSTDAQTTVSAYQLVPMQQFGTILKLTAEMRSADVVLGQKPWNLARLVFVQHDGDKDRWELPHTVAAINGSHDWMYFHNAFTIMPETKQIRVMAQLNQSSGFFQLKNIRLYPVKKSPIFPFVKSTILGAWGIFFALLIGSCFLMRGSGIASRLLLIIAILSIVIGTTLPGDLKQEVSTEFIMQIQADSEQFKAIVPWDLSKVWHLGIFFLLGMVLGFIGVQGTFLQMATITLLMAGGTELAQFYIDGRTPLLSDFFLDAAGGILGLILVRLVRN